MSALRGRLDFLKGDFLYTVLDVLLREPTSIPLSEQRRNDLLDELEDRPMVVGRDACGEVFSRPRGPHANTRRALSIFVRAIDAPGVAVARPGRIAGGAACGPDLVGDARGEGSS